MPSKTDVTEASSLTGRRKSYPACSPVPGPLYLSQPCCKSSRPRPKDTQSWDQAAFELQAMRDVSQASLVADYYSMGLCENSFLLDSMPVDLTDRAFDDANFNSSVPAIPWSVIVMYFIAFLSHWTQTLTEFITWFVVESRSWTRPDDASYYGLIYGIFLFGPVVMNPTVGWLSDIFAIKHVIIGAHIVATIGILVMMSSQSQSCFALGAFLYACLAVRPLRTTYIAMATDPSVRTKAMAYLNLFTDASKLLGVITAKAWAQMGPVPPNSWQFYSFHLDYLALALLTAAALLVINTVVLTLFFRDETNRSSHIHLPTILWTKDIKVEACDKQIQVWNGDRYVFLITVYFCCIGFLHQMSYGLITVSNLPVLSHIFKLNKSAVANVKLCQDLLPCAGPIMIARLSNYLSDRSLFISGIVLAFFGIAVFAAPLGKSMTWLQPLAGLVCMSVSQQFFYTADFSIFSKVLGPRATGLRMAALASGSALGATLGAYLGGKVSEHLYGSWLFYTLASPSLIALSLVLHPWFFSIVGPDSPIVAQLVHQWKVDEAAALWDARVQDAEINPGCLRWAPEGPAPDP